MARAVVLASLAARVGARRRPAAAQDSARTVAAAQPGRGRDLPLDATRNVNIDTDEGSWLSLDVSPDGRTIVFDLLGDLYTIPIAGGDGDRAHERDGSTTRSRASVPTASSSSSRPTATAATTSGPSTSRPRQTQADHEAARATATARPSGRPTATTSSCRRAADVRSDHRSCGCSTRTAAAARSSIRDPQPMLAGAFPSARWAPRSGRTTGTSGTRSARGAWEYNAAFPQYQLMTFDRQTGPPRDARKRLRLGVPPGALARWQVSRLRLAL